MTHGVLVTRVRDSAEVNGLGRSAGSDVSKREALVHGYVKRGSELDNQLRLASDERSRPMILRVRHQNEGSQESQVLIDSIVETGWVKDLPK